MNCEAARQQADCCEDGELKNLSRRRSAETLAKVVDVGDYEDQKDGSFREDETQHADNAARWQLPVFGRILSRNGYFTHTKCSQPVGFGLFVESVRVVWMLQIPKWTATLDNWRIGEVV